MWSSSETLGVERFPSSQNVHPVAVTDRSPFGALFSGGIGSLDAPGSFRCWPCQRHSPMAFDAAVESSDAGSTGSRVGGERRRGQHRRDAPKGDASDA